MNQYELTLVVSPKAAEKKPEAESLVKKLLKKFKLEKMKLENWGKKDTTYPINGHDSAWYVLLEFELNPEKINELEQEIKLNEEIIRYLLVRR